MSTTTNVEFYEKIRHLQDSHHENEQKRMDLEQQLNSYIRSDSRLARLKAVRLQNYWKKICDDEKRSQSRNEQLLRDLERVESHMGTLSARTDKLRAMKNQYERYIEQTYPNWKEKILHHQRLQQHHEKQQQHLAQMDAAGYNPTTMAPAAGYISLPHQEAYRISTTLPAPSLTDAQLQRHYLGSDGGLSAPQSLPHMGAANQQGVSGTDSALHLSQLVGNPPPPMSVHLDTVQQQDVRGHFVSQPQEVREMMLEARNVPKPQQQTALSDSERRVNAAAMAGVLRTAPEEDGFGDDTGEESVGEDAIEPTSSPRRPVKWNQPEESPPKQSPHAPAYHATDDTDDFDTDMSLPMSGADVKPTVAPPIDANTDQRTAAPVERVQSPQSVYLQPDITIDDLYNLLSAIEEELPRTQQGNELYQVSHPPANSVKREIYQNANKRAMLSHINAASICSVVLEQLPLLIMGCETDCLLPDDILYRPSVSASQESVRAKIHGTSQALWDRLCTHFLHLLKYKILSTSAIGQVFGPLLVNMDSPYEAKAQALVTIVMENSDPDVIESPRSTSTFSTFPPVSPRKRTDDVDVAGHIVKITPPPKSDLEKPVEIPQQGISENRIVTDKEQVSPAPVTSTPLTQTAAYRQLLGDTMSTSQKSVSYDDSEDDDDIEQQLGSMVSGKPESPQKESKKTGLTPDDADRPFSPSGVSRGSSPSQLSAGAGYIPSGIDMGGKSATGSFGSSGKNAKKGPAFLYGGDTDTDEDIDIPGMGPIETAGPVKHGQEEDDFDFYG